MTILNEKEAIIHSERAYLHYDFEAGENNVIQITFNPGVEATVQLMDEINYDNLKSGRPYSYYGGKTSESLNMRPPRFGKWHLVVDQAVTINLI
jgi:hypothetical protein